MAGSPLTLADVRIGDSCTVRKVACGRSTAVRLMEMGLLPGSVVKVERKAPLGDPLVLSVDGYQLSIRKAEAALVAIEPASSKAAEKVSSRSSEPEGAPVSVDSVGAEAT